MQCTKKIKTLKEKENTKSIITKEYQLKKKGKELDEMFEEIEKEKIVPLEFVELKSSDYKNIDEETVETYEEKLDNLIKIQLVEKQKLSSNEKQLVDKKEERQECIEKIKKLNTDKIDDEIISLNILCSPENIEEFIQSQKLEEQTFKSCSSEKQGVISEIENLKKRLVFCCEDAIDYDQLVSEKTKEIEELKTSLEKNDIVRLKIEKYSKFLEKKKILDSYKRELEKTQQLDKIQKDKILHLGMFLDIIKRQNYKLYRNLWII
jgi:hypothetical protein